MKTAKSPAVKKKVSKKAPAKKPVKKAVAKKVESGTPLKSAKVEEATSLTRKILYPEVQVRLYQGDTALTEEEAKKLLMWEEETEHVKFAGDYLLVDGDNKKIRCYNNINNRAFDKNWAKTLEGNILNKQWTGPNGRGKTVNGESMIIGQTGLNISCQHRLVGFVLACQEWRKNPEKWSMWDTQPVMDCVIVFGVDESDETVDTIDTGKPRTLTDVIYRSEIFRTVKPSDRKSMSQATAYAIRTVADRTGAWVDAFGPKRTHPEMIDFLNRHYKILDCVKHVYEESEGDASKTFVTMGVAAGLLYLMQASATEPSVYITAENRAESLLDLANEDKAQTFWVNLIHRKMPALVAVMGRFTVDLQGEEGVEPETNGGTVAERIATICKAWTLYAAKKPVTEESLKLLYHVEEGVRTLAECPTVGGIDMGNPKDSTDVIPPTPEELEQAKRDITEESRTAKAESNVAVKKAAKKKAGHSDKPKDGDMVYCVIDAENGVWWGGTLMETYPVEGGRVMARVNITLPKSMKDKTEEVELHCLTTVKPA